MSNTSKRRAEHQAIVAAVRSRQQSKQRRFNILLYGGFGVALAAIITAVALAVIGSIQERNDATEAAKKPIDGIQTYADLSRNHVQNPVAYPQKPGVGGDHSPAWINCGTYTDPVNEQRAVHSLEHGAVWITYNPGLPAAEIARLTTLAKDKSYVLLSPAKNQSAPVTATAWGAQLGVHDVEDPRVPAFISAYARSPKAPEPGAACTGGTNG